MKRNTHQNSKKQYFNIYKISCVAFIAFCAICLIILVAISINHNQVAKYVIEEQESLIAKQHLVTPIIMHFNSSESLKNERLQQLIKRINPFGFIFYDYQKTSYDEIKKINSELISLFPNRKIYIAVDQEGGLVNRLRKFEQEKNITLLKKASYYGKIAEKNLAKAKQEIYFDSRRTAKILKDLKFNVNLAPMLDLRESHKYHRIYSSNPQITYELGLSFIQGMHDEGIMVTLKHLPGIGRNKQDTHKQEVRINATKQELIKYDLVPFKKLAPISQFGMVTHATYTKIDNKPATISKKTIDFIKEQIGFKGLLISDAFNMTAISSVDSYGQNAINALKSGIDIIITNCSSHHCDINVVNAIQETGYIEKFNKKLRRFEESNNLNLK